MIDRAACVTPQSPTLPGTLPGRRRRRARIGLLSLAIALGGGSMGAVLAPADASGDAVRIPGHAVAGTGEPFMRADAGIAGEWDASVRGETGDMPLPLPVARRARPPDKVYPPMFLADLGEMGQGNAGCGMPPSDPTAAYRDWCGDESALIAAVEIAFARRWPGCRPARTRTRIGYPGIVSLAGAASTARGTIRYRMREMTTTAQCGNGQTRTLAWRIVKQRTLYCAPGFRAASLRVTEGMLAEADLCLPGDDGFTRAAPDGGDPPLPGLG